MRYEAGWGIVNGAQRRGTTLLWSNHFILYQGESRRSRCVPYGQGGTSWLLLRQKGLRKIELWALILRMELLEHGKPYSKRLRRLGN